MRTCALLPILVAACATPALGVDERALDDAPLAIPAAAPYDAWTFVPTPDARCADGSPTGFAVSPHLGSDRLLILVRGGGVCWDYQHCVGNPTPVYLDGYGPAQFDAERAAGWLDRGILDRSDPTNPYRDANLAYVPYCTGDLHLGTNVTTYASPSGAAVAIHHVGSTNIAVFLRRLVPTFAGVGTVAVAGYSAGGFGATWNLPQIATAFAATAPAMILIDDSGPFLRTPWFTEDLELTLDQRYHAGASVPGCGACSPSAGGQLAAIYAHVGATVPGLRGALLSSTRDLVLSAAFARPPGDPALACADAGACTFAVGLLDLADHLAALRREPIKSFLVKGDEHVFVTKPLGGFSTNGLTVAAWLGQQLDDDPAWVSQRP